MTLMVLCLQSAFNFRKLFLSYPVVTNIFFFLSVLKDPSLDCPLVLTYLFSQSETCSSCLWIYLFCPTCGFGIAVALSSMLCSFK